MNTLIMTVGLPRSGKTTRVKVLGHPIVNPDSIRLAIHGRPYIQTAEPLVWATAKYMVRSLFIAGHKTVVLDSTNTTRKRRDEWASKEWSRDFEVVLTSLEDCLERAHKQYSDDEESRNGLIGAIKRMHEGWEHVSEDELLEHEIEQRESRNE